MQIAVMVVFLVVWLIILWIGSIALEATGMIRSRARFQALSCLTGTGFTTTEAESVVNHPRRRRIATWLIFIGNAGIISGLILMIQYLRSGLVAPSRVAIITLVVVVVLVFLLVRLKIVHGITNAFVKMFRGKTDLHTREFVLQTGDYGIARVGIREDDKPSGKTVKDTIVHQTGITVLAIERGNTVLSPPAPEEAVLPGDFLLCYGKTADILRVTR
jgi:hypothetical protein